jgi:y4mF family transcriptional regulator
LNKNNNLKKKKRAPRRNLEQILAEAGPIAGFVRKRRKELGYTQTQLAQRSGLSAKFIREFELGKTTAKMESVNKLLAFFGYELTVQPIQRNEGLE